MSKLLAVLALLVSTSALAGAAKRAAQGAASVPSRPAPRPLGAVYDRAGKTAPAKPAPAKKQGPVFTH